MTKYQVKDRDTGYIPTPRISEQDLVKRMVPRRAYLDTGLWVNALTECGTSLIPEIPEIPGIPEFPYQVPRFTKLPEAGEVLIQMQTGCGKTGTLEGYIQPRSDCNVFALNTAKCELTNLNRAAVRVFISASLANVADLPTQGSDVLLIDRDTVQSWQCKVGTLTTENPVTESRDELPSFYKPIALDWSKNDQALIDAAREYSEQTHADY